MPTVEHWLNEEFVDWFDADVLQLLPLPLLVRGVAAVRPLIVPHVAWSICDIPCSFLSYVL